ncbi:hypothetical protein ACQ46_gp078 [Citrobacter phage Moon]|uniref:Uncharacterized protein n=2 Tax=Moonvirus TaxID=1985329 RepID=A0A2H4YFK9_9CAUD|nr:hypothetical protein ACQ46_gp078 [Citrobacter phage Moon]YP_009618137.1 hypothetical protein FDI95_gp078 [Citrobacter phage CF1 ERZ-2017]AIX12049.1 hypothetical protein CPT_Moon78 [Citrobacter phage Moon]AUE22951.1 hypothetical protein Cf1_00078 [Citrobacter phage CF1 ERZ-2017]
MKRSLVLEILHIPTDNSISTAAREVFNEEGLEVGDRFIVTAGKREHDIWAWPIMFTKNGLRDIKDFDESWAFVTHGQIESSPHWVLGRHEKPLFRVIK